MRLSVRLGALLFVAPLLVDGADAGVYRFTFSGSGFSGAGVIVASGASAPFDVVDISGTVSDSTYDSGAPSRIAGLSGFLGSDNQLNYPGEPFVDPNGLAFFTANGDEFNLSGFGTSYYMTSFGSLYYADVVFPLPVGFNVVATPEPPSWSLMVLGFATLGLFQIVRARRG